jgi:hypothetical protein
VGVVVIIGLGGFARNENDGWLESESRRKYTPQNVLGYRRGGFSAIKIAGCKL